ncbi:MAG: flagellar assembly protein FliW [Candidatus Wallbacteria bacterium HGW-Wallbacteria-1]|jgi:flagellar assembly factor FliW|uniref:Flagellar assembly factor FliW n=1 Tax=Candidatus Wallbacteria bacterium HGW-Wallbacteria-1 TaxID=2013854 RepID=A0A2N1PUI4_9BACT|nr:MAG: flagellar assembly protein FliW [Candidatus Wallbacteria bacterium HGW-Wallbacteria-1]
MLVTTTRFGDIEVAADTVITFREGLLGFADSHRFTILSGDEDSLFKWLQSVEDGSLAFIVIEPDLFMEDYSIDLSESDVKGLEIENPEDVNVLTLVTVPSNPQEISANLQGPLVINSRKLLGKQVISTNLDHKLRYYLLSE